MPRTLGSEVERPRVLRLLEGDDDAVLYDALQYGAREHEHQARSKSPTSTPRIRDMHTRLALRMRKLMKQYAPK